MSDVVSSSDQIYLEVLVSGASFHGSEALTYSHSRSLPTGTIVIVPLRSSAVLGVVVNAVERPAFPVKPITEAPQLPMLPTTLLTLLHWIREYYPSPLGVITGQFLPKKLPKKPLEERILPDLPDLPLPPLTDDQRNALNTITGPGTYLLHGDTGTGKTRIYIELAKQSLKAKRSVLVLTPEIGLTSQLASDFRQAFGDRVTVIHSQLSEATRHRLWVSLLKERQPVIVLGPRSALFSPLHNIGLVVVDEAHEPAYKQDQAPYYHAARIASQLATMHKAPLILGSATPLISDYYIAEQKKRPIIRMQQIAVASKNQETKTSVVDLKDRTKFTKKPHLSDELIAAISSTLQRHEQSLLFLNRRGTARIVFCTNCGWQATCPHCDLFLVYHGDKHIMRCHTCDFKTSVPVNCPECYNASIVFKSIGTKAIVDEIASLFPEARIMRFDTDNKKAERIEEHYGAVKKGEVDIIVGTQTLAKGLDLPSLSLVGVIVADTSLYFPDFSAQERTYQLLSQVIGRVGRGHRSASVILQTYNPDSPLLKSILTKNWHSFYQQELEERKLFLFPPFCYLLKLTCRRATSDSAAKAAETLAYKLQTLDLKIRIEGPAPAFHEKIQNKYQWQLVIKAKDRSELVKVIGQLPSGWSYDIDPMDLL